MSATQRGTIILMGSGETSPGMAKVHRQAMSRLSQTVQPAFIDTPAGFQLNADDLGTKAVEYFARYLNYNLEVASFKSARTATPEQTQLAVRTLRGSNYIFAGPGSPTYAINNWRGTLILDAMLEAVSRGGCLTFSSAAALTTGRFTIPVYEIYKVGESVHWVDGLNILGQFGLEVCVIPHWNNTSGGDHDTQYCFMGEPRWHVLEQQIPTETTVLGIDENTACILDFESDMVVVQGKGRVIVHRLGVDEPFIAGQSFPLNMLRPYSSESSASPLNLSEETILAWDNIRVKREKLLSTASPSMSQVAAYLFDLVSVLGTARERHDWNELQRAEEALHEGLVALTAGLDTAGGDLESVIEPFVDLLVQFREDLRDARQWELADRVRDRLAQLDIAIEDGRGQSSWHWRRDTHQQKS